MPEQPESIAPPPSLLEKLTAAYQQACALKFMSNEMELLEALNSQDREVSSSAAIQLHTLGEQLIEPVVKDARFLGSNPRLVRIDNGSSGFYPHYVGECLIRRTFQTGSPEAAIAWLQKVLSATAATGKTIHALWGVPVDREIQLTRDVKIVPIDNLPDSVNKQRITGGQYWAKSLVISMLNFKPPESALMVCKRIEPFTYDPDTLSNPPQNDSSQTHELLQDVALVLTVIGPRVPISAMQWFTFDDPDFEEANRLAGMSMRQFIEILPDRHTDYPVLDPNIAAPVVEGYLALAGDTRQKVRLALQRLNQAQRRHNIGDRAVELSIAFETLLGDNANTEMTHKIKVRSVRLIGGTSENRKRNAAIINKAYSIRSKLVHTGHVDASRSETVCEEKMSHSEIIDHTIAICADLIKIIISRGSIPDWSSFDISEHT